MTNLNNRWFWRVEPRHNASLITTDTKWIDKFIRSLPDDMIAKNISFNGKDITVFGRQKDATDGYIYERPFTSTFYMLARANDAHIYDDDEYAIMNDTAIVPLLKNYISAFERLVMISDELYSQHNVWMRSRIVPSMSNEIIVEDGCESHNEWYKTVHKVLAEITEASPVTETYSNTKHKLIIDPSSAATFIWTEDTDDNGATIDTKENANESV